jgi:hypothetical protein
MLKTLAKLGLIEAYQSYLEGEDYYYEDIENAEDEFFKEDINDEDL